MTLKYYTVIRQEPSKSKKIQAIGDPALGVLQA
jgi:hypothetical protein